MTNVLKRANPYEKTVWYDRIIDIESGTVLQEGTRFNQKRANNIEEGVYGAYNCIIDVETLVKRMQAQLEIDGRVPGNLGSYYDTFDGTATRMSLDTTKTDVTASIVAGVTTIPVASTTGFDVMTYATIYDNDSYEDVLITEVNEAAKTITVQALTSDYVKGAKVARSTAGIDTDSQNMAVAPFITHNVQLVEVV